MLKWGNALLYLAVASRQFKTDPYDYSWLKSVINSTIFKTTIKKKFLPVLILVFPFPRENATLWDTFHLSMSQDELYGAHDQTVNRLLKYMTTLPISHISKYQNVLYS